MGQGIGKDVDIDLLAVLDLIAPAATALLAAFLGGIGGVVESFGRVDQNDLAVDLQSLQDGGASFLEMDTLDFEDRME